MKKTLIGLLFVISAITFAGDKKLDHCGEIVKKSYKGVVSHYSMTTKGPRAYLNLYKNSTNQFLCGDSYRVVVSFDRSAYGEMELYEMTKLAFRPEAWLIINLDKEISNSNIDTSFDDSIRYSILPAQILKLSVGVHTKMKVKPRK